MCSTVDDFFMPAEDERSLKTSLDKALGTSGFQPSTHRLDVLGTCPNCA